jgi:putative ABC transport system permease protein
MSRTKRIARDVVDSLLANKQRALLMMLGVAVGVGVLSAVIVIGQGTRDRIMGLVSKHGLDMLMVRAGGDVQVFAPKADRGLTVLFPEDAQAIETSIPNVQMASVVQNQRGINVVNGDVSVTTRAFGVEPDWIEIRRWGMAEGEFLSAADMDGMRRVVMLGARVARELFPKGGAVGTTVRVSGDPYIVKGVFIEMGASAGGDDWDDRVVVPFTTSSKRLFGRQYLEQVVVRVADARRMPETAQQVRELLRVRHTIGQGKPDDFYVREPEDVQNAALDTSSTLSTLLLVIAVSYRAHEIGVRRAAGARATDIQRQFLFESLIISLAGGVVGVTLGIGTALAMSSAGIATTRITWVPFVAAFVCCVVIGVAFGIHPARKAARVEPAATLREARI